jgi:chromosomal replication initiation ATPase DnaA
VQNDEARIAYVLCEKFWNEFINAIRIIPVGLPPRLPQFDVLLVDVIQSSRQRADAGGFFHP